jgi:hypothetical protein
LGIWLRTFGVSKIYGEDLMNKLHALRIKAILVKTAIMTAVLSASISAHAALPVWATGVGDQIKTRATETEGEVGPVIAAVVVALVGITLFKRFSRKI